MIVNWVESVVCRNLARSLAEEVSVSKKTKRLFVGAAGPSLLSSGHDPLRWQS